MEVFKTPGPAFLASALINGDESGLEPDDMADLEWFRNYIEDAEVVDCGEPYFSWHFALYSTGRFNGGDLVEYTCIRRD
jgi:hypothetical protein